MVATDRHQEGRHSRLKWEWLQRTYPNAFQHKAQAGVPLDTAKILFICGGAFVGMEEIVGKRLGRSGFGFGQVSENRQVCGLLRQVLPEELECFGLIPELIDRLPVVATLNTLGLEDLTRILTQPTNSLISQARKLVKFHGADLVFTDAAINEIARVALERGTGARGLRSVVEEVLEGVLFDVEAVVRFVITDKTVRGGEAVRQSMSQPRAPLCARVRWRVGVTRSSYSLPCRDAVVRSELGILGLTPTTYFVL